MSDHAICWTLFAISMALAVANHVNARRNRRDLDAIVELLEHAAQDEAPHE